jgi:hypothetical protein
MKGQHIITYKRRSQKNDTIFKDVFARVHEKLKSSIIIEFMSIITNFDGCYPPKSNYFPIV